MSRFVVRLMAGAMGWWLASAIVPGVSVHGLGALLLAALLLGVVNAVVAPVLVILTLPLTIVTLGLFLLVINAAMFALVGALVPGVRVDGLLAALLGSVVVSLVSGLVGAMDARERRRAR